MDRLCVVEFRNEMIRGTCVKSSGEISISRAVLSNYYLTLMVLIHEVSHCLSGNGDAKLGFEGMLETIWMAVMFSGSDAKFSGSDAKKQLTN
jgi:hypothetical protein